MLNERVVCVLSKNKKERMNNNRIKEIRLSQHKTQKDLAKLLGVSEQAIAYYEKALREPPLKTWLKLANFFNVPVSYLQGVSNIPAKVTSEKFANIVSKLDFETFKDETLKGLYEWRFEKLIQIINICFNDDDFDDDDDDDFNNYSVKDELYKFLGNKSFDFEKTSNAYVLLTWCLEILIKGQTKDKKANIAFKQLEKVIDEYADFDSLKPNTTENSRRTDNEKD